MRDLLILAVICGSLPIILFRPFLGLMVYSWLAYMRPQDMAWGLTRSLPLSQWVAIAMAVGLLIAMGREQWVTFRLQTFLLILLAGWISLSALNALVPEMAQEVYGHYWKAILITVLTTGMVRDRRRLRILLLLIVFSIGFLGAKRGLFGLLRGGARFHDGPGGFMSDNNSFALVLCMILPLLVGLALTEKRQVVRLAAAAVAALCTLSVLFTFSRGGFLTLCLVGSMLVWRSRRRLVVGGVLAVGLACFVLFSSDQLANEYVDRASSISDYEEDGSAQGRITAWKTSWAVFLDYPLLGVGPNNFAAVYDRYSPVPGRFRVAHNSYLQLLAECGLPAMLLFAGAIAASYWRLQRLRGATTVPWVELQARMFQISILGYVLGSMFLNQAYNELIYHLMGLSVSLEVVAAQEARAEAADPAATAPAADLPWWKRPPAGRTPAPGWTGGA